MSSEDKVTPRKETAAKKSKSALRKVEPVTSAELESVDDNPAPLHSQSFQLPNTVEVDTTGDGIPDTIMIDSNGDGNPDQVVSKMRHVAERTLLNDILQKKKTYQLAAEYYSNKHKRLYIPTIIITALSGFISFLSTSSMVTADMKNWLSVTVGLMATLATVLGSLQNTFSYSTKAEVFESAANSFGVVATRIEFAMRSPDSNCDSHWWKLMGDKVLDINKRITFQVPMHQMRRWGRLGYLKGINEDENEQHLPSWLSDYEEQLNKLGVVCQKDLSYLTDADLKAAGFPPATVRKIAQTRLNLATVLAGELNLKARKKAKKLLDDHILR